MSRSPSLRPAVLSPSTEGRIMLTRQRISPPRTVSSKPHPPAAWSSAPMSGLGGAQPLRRPSTCIVAKNGTSGCAPNAAIPRVSSAIRAARSSAEIGHTLGDALDEDRSEAGEQRQFGTVRSEPGAGIAADHGVPGKPRQYRQEQEQE